MSTNLYSFIIYRLLLELALLILSESSPVTPEVKSIFCHSTNKILQQKTDIESIIEAKLLSSGIDSINIINTWNHSPETEQLMRKKSILLINEGKRNNLKNPILEKIKFHLDSQLEQICKDHFKFTYKPPISIKITPGSDQNVSQRPGRGTAAKKNSNSGLNGKRSSSLSISDKSKSESLRGLGKIIHIYIYITKFFVEIIDACHSTYF